MKRLLIISLSLLLLLSACNGKKVPSRYSAEFIGLFDTFTQIIGYADSKEEFTAHAEEIYSQLKVYHELYDIYNNYDGINNLKTINDNAGIEPVKVDRKIIDLLLYSKEMYNLTNGKCNIALGSVLSIWHNYRKVGINDPESAVLPPVTMLTDASAHIDINKIIIDDEKSTVYLEDSAMLLDVGSIGKGYAVERVAFSMSASGVDNILLSVGGNIRAIGGRPSYIGNNPSGGKGDENPQSLPWRVGIRDPFDDEGGDLTVLAINGISLVTSGDYERYYMVKSEKYHHIIDPSTLMPAAYFTSVTIVCADSGMADALSTAVFCMSYEEGRTLIDLLPDVEAMWVYHDGKVVSTDGFDVLVLS